MVNRSVSTGKNRWIFALILVLAALMATIWFIRQSDIASVATRILLPAELAHTIDIVTDKHLITLKKSNSAWQLLHPTETAANQDRVNPLLSLLVLPAKGLYEANEVDLEELGLTSPLATVKINDIEFSFGSTGASPNTRYVRVNETIYLTDDILYPLIQLGPDGFKAERTQNSDQ